ncbi:unnamed protein product [Phytophthora fragariaefolia]|uniref:Unnamed protein product n=1 Tax=Phytophthora fragariaefolia TaxID=1490495 RepID=A0A9W6XBR7_9STRA|nr:unnamed protein product [Phytophthora fragariaefolia]
MKCCILYCILCCILTRPIFVFSTGAEGGEIEASVLGNELLQANNDDLNLVDDEADAYLYGAMESGDDGEKDDIETGGYDSNDREGLQNEPEDSFDDPEEAEQEADAEINFAESFLERFGGEDEVLAGNLKNQVLREMAVNGWEYVISPHTNAYMMTPYEHVTESGSYP